MTGVPRDDSFPWKGLLLKGFRHSERWFCVMACGSEESF